MQLLQIADAVHADIPHSVSQPAKQLVNTFMDRHHRRIRPVIGNRIHMAENHIQTRITLLQLFRHRSIVRTDQIIDARYKHNQHPRPFSPCLQTRKQLACRINHCRIISLNNILFLYKIVRQPVPDPVLHCAECAMTPTGSRTDKQLVGFRKHHCNPNHPPAAISRADIPELLILTQLQSDTPP